MVLLFLQIPYDKTGGKQNLVSLIRQVAANTTRYGAEFSKLTRVGAYYATIDDDATAVFRTCTKAAHKAKHSDRVTYKTVWRDPAQFILDTVEDTWVQEIRGTETFNTNVAPKMLLANL